MASSTKGKGVSSLTNFLPVPGNEEYVQASSPEDEATYNDEPDYYDDGSESHSESQSGSDFRLQDNQSDDFWATQPDVASSADQFEETQHETDFMGERYDGGEVSTWPASSMEWESFIRHIAEPATAASKDLEDRKEADLAEHRRLEQAEKIDRMSRGLNILVGELEATELEVKASDIRNETQAAKYKAYTADQTAKYEAHVADLKVELEEMKAENTRILNKETFTGVIECTDVQTQEQVHKIHIIPVKNVKVEPSSNESIEEIKARLIEKEKQLQDLCEKDAIRDDQLNKSNADLQKLRDNNEVTCSEYEELKDFSEEQRKDNMELRRINEELKSTSNLNSTTHHRNQDDKIRELEGSNMRLETMLKKQLDVEYSCKMRAEKRSLESKALAIEMMIFRCQQILIGKILVSNEHIEDTLAVDIANDASRKAVILRDKRLEGQAKFWAGVASYSSHDLKGAETMFRSCQSLHGWTEEKYLKVWYDACQIGLTG